MKSCVFSFVEVVTQKQLNAIRYYELQQSVMTSLCHLQLIKRNVLLMQSVSLYNSSLGMEIYLSRAAQPRPLVIK